MDVEQKELKCARAVFRLSLFRIDLVLINVSTTRLLFFSRCRHCLHYLLRPISCPTPNHQSTELLSVIVDPATSLGDLLFHQWHSLLPRLDDQSDLLPSVLEKIPASLHENDETSRPLSTKTPVFSPRDEKCQTNGKYLSTARKKKSLSSTSAGCARIRCSATEVN